jgi:hypothetical protein
MIEAEAALIVNHKKIRRLMREHGLQPRIRRRYVVTVADRLLALRGPGESYSDVILRLVEIEARS